MTSPSRRRFLRHALAWPLGLNALQWSSLSLASGSGDYRALVCIFLQGGNDAFNTVLATDSASWGHYQDHRNPASRSSSATDPSIALLAPGTTPQPGSSDLLAQLGGVLALPAGQRSDNSGRSFALHPSLSNIAGLYASSRVAIVPNVGPLLAPTTKADWLNDGVSKPAKLFSHIDQQYTWQSFGTNGAGLGWGGRMADMLRPDALSASSQAWRTLACMSPSTEALWLCGAQSQPFYSSATDVLTLGDQQTVWGNAALYTAMRQIMAGDDDETHLLRLAHQDAVRRGLASSDMLSPLMPSRFVGPWGTPGATSVWDDPLLQYSAVAGSGMNALAVQLQMVARSIEANRLSGSGVNRQMFFVTLDGFDTHSQQVSQHALRLAQLDHAMGYFDQLLAGMPGGNLRNQVTTFTCSDFGRSFTSNGDGTDHGWGGHHLVMGGAVQGGEVYGRFPTYSTADADGNFSSPDQIQNGVLLPAISVDQYAATLGRWMGLSDAQLLSILPNLGQFPSDQRDLGFMTA